MKFLAWVMLAVSLRAQPVPISPADADERRIITERFSSTQPADLAWGAHLAANYRQPSFIPQIVELLRHSEWVVRTVAFNALIRLRADVSPDALAPLVKNHFDEVVILQARDVKKNGPFLNTLLDGPLESWQWVALNSILSQAPPPGYAARLFREWRPRFEITVWDPLPSSGSGGGFGGCGDGGGFYQPDFPPVVFYRLGRGETRLAGGPHPVYYEVVRSHSRCFSGISRDEYTLDYLRVLTGVSAARPRNASLTWTTPAQYQREAQRFRNSVRIFLVAIREALVGRGLLTPEDVATLLVAEITVVDRREDPSVPLPVIDLGL